MTGKTAIVIGATGLVGGHCLQGLLDSPDYQRVIAVSRRAVAVEHPKLQRIETAFEHLGAALKSVQADDAFCCLGTTIRQAGSKSAFHQVDYGYALAFAQAVKNGGAAHFLLVSALGAKAGSLVFYNRVKGLLEKDIQALAFAQLSIFRPSLLVGDRPEHRTGEALGLQVSNLISPFLRGPLSATHPIPGAEVAQAMVACARLPHAAAVSTFHYTDMQLLRKKMSA